MQMELILLKAVKNLGKTGDSARVAMGYGRYLLRQKWALRATAENRENFQAERQHWETLNLRHKEEAEDLATHLEGKIFLLIRQSGETGHLYGSVSTRDIADVMLSEGFKVDRTMVHLPHPIKMIGTHTLSLELHPEVHTSVHVLVAKTEEEGASHKAALEASLMKKDSPQTPSH